METDIEKLYHDMIRFFSKKVEAEVIVSRLLMAYENMLKLV
jgi:hypothetical protein